MMLKDFEDINDPANPELSGQHWLTFRKYDAQGRTIFEAEPSAVTGYDEDSPDLLVSQAGNYLYLADHAGLIHLTDYGTSTTATATTSGDVLGYFKDSKVQQGELGTAVLQEAKDYKLKSNGGKTNIVLADASVYRNSDGSGEATTSYGYDWYPSTVAVQSVMQFLPTVSAAEHGAGSSIAGTTTVCYDLLGRPVWTRDAAGFITYTAYDNVTGAVVKTITDVDTDHTGDFTGLPTGWSTPTGGGLHLVITARVDALGRIIEQTDPDGLVTYTVYDDVNQEVRVYAGWNSATHNVAGTVAVRRADRAGNYSEVLTFVWNDPSGLPVDAQGRPTGAESLSDSRVVIQSLLRTLLDSAGQVAATRQYTSLSGLGYSMARNLGSKGVNYLETTGDFGSFGRITEITDPSGTIQHLFYDSMGRVATEWQGTDDVPDADYNGDGITDALDFRYWVDHHATANEGPAGTAMHKATANVYDFNGVGDGNLTAVTDYFSAAGGDSSVTYYQYDWHDRLTGTLTPDGVAVIDMLDNLGKVTESQTYAGSSYSSGQIVPGNLRAQSQTSYDKLGRWYEDRVYEVTVDPTTGEGTAGDYLATDVWYDPRGYAAKVVTGGDAFTKRSYDGAGRLATVYTCYDSDEAPSDYAAALNVEGDTVVEQAQTWYDGNGQAVATATFKRLPDDTTSTGALTAANCYVTASAAWYDAVGRVTAQVDYGREDTDSGLAHCFFDGTTGELIDTDADGRPDVVEAAPPAPNASDDYLVTQTVYTPRLSAAGPIVDRVDNAGRIAETQYDLAGRAIRTIDNYDDGAVQETDTDQDVTIEYQYDAFGRLATLTAVNAKGDGEGIVEEETRYLYQSPNDASLQTAVVSPDSTDVLSQDPATGRWSIATDNGDHTSTSYDWQGRTVSATDQRGVVHAYSYDSAGRLAADTVTSLGRAGENVDGAVRRLGYTYDDLGRNQAVTSYSDTAGTTVLNQDFWAYDGWGNAIAEWQAHDGAVNTTSAPSVQYVYESPRPSGEGQGEGSHPVKYVRLTDLVYPNGRDVVYGYGAEDSIDDVLSRVLTIGDGTQTYAAYSYLGVGGIVGEDYQQPQVKLDYTADNFAAFDRFGRVLEQVWSSYGANPETIDGYTYTYNRAGNRTSRGNATDAALSQLYGYDDLDQLTSTTRNDGHTQGWNLDSLGNWADFTDDSVTESKTFNAANEALTSSGQAAPQYDAAGNVITTAKPGDESTAVNCTYDAWNRLVAADDGTTTVTYAYDGQDRRIERTAAGTSEHFYYDGQQVVETRTSDGQNAAATDKQYVWSLRYIDTPILRDSYASGALVAAARLYYLSDANHNVTAVVSASGAVQERYDYDAYGKATVYDADWANPSGVSALGNTRLFAGQDFDTATGLAYDRARWYNAATGSFLARDPLGFRAGDANLYRYVGANPANYVDPSGKFVWMAPLAGAALSTGVYVATALLTHQCITLGGLVGSALGGAVFAMATPLGLPLAGGLSSALGAALQQLIDNSGNVNWGQVLADGGMGLSLGLILQAGGNLLAAKLGGGMSAGGGPGWALAGGGMLSGSAAVEAAALEQVLRAAGAAGPGLTTALMEGNSGGNGGDAEAPRRTPAENAKARNTYKNKKDAAREAWEQRTGQKWPVDKHGNSWPGEHTPPLKEGGDPMHVTPRDPGLPDPHAIPGPDGLTDYQRWGAEGTPARQANRNR